MLSPLNAGEAALEDCEDGAELVGLGATEPVCKLDRELEGGIKEPVERGVSPGRIDIIPETLGLMESVMRDTTDPDAPFPVSVSVDKVEAALECTHALHGSMMHT